MSTREVLEVAVVDADHVGVDLERRLELVRRREISTIASRSSAPATVVERRELRRARSDADHEQHRVGAGRLRLVELVGVDREVLAQDRQVGGGARLAQVVERAAEVGLLGEDRERRRAAALVGAHDLGAARALADRRPPRASGACARRSATCRGATAPRRTGRPSLRRARPRARARPAGRSRLRRSSASRVASTRSSRRTLTTGSCVPDEALEHVRARRPSRSPPPPCGRRPRASRRGRPRRSRRRRSSRSATRSVPGVARRARARAMPAFSSGVPARHAPSGGGLEADVSRGRRRRRRCRPSLSSTTRVGPATRELVEPIGARHYQCVLAAELAEGRGHGLEVAGGPTRRSPGGVAPAGLVSGPRKLKIVRTAELLAHRDHVLHRRVVARREHEAEADLVDARRPPRPGSRSMRAPSASSTSAEPQRLGGRAVAVLGDPAARARRRRTPRWSRR